MHAEKICLFSDVCVLQKLVGVAHTSVRLRSGLPFNTVILFVPQQEAWVIERFGKFHRVLEPVMKSRFYLFIFILNLSAESLSKVLH